MQFFKALNLTCAVVLITFSSCNPCSSSSSYLGCGTNDDPQGNYRIIRKTDKKDLLFGANRVYDANKIKVYTLKGIDTTFLPTRPVKDNGFGYDSSLYIRFFPIPDVAYLRLSDGDIDTIRFETYVQKDRCCDATIRVRRSEYNAAETNLTYGGVIEK